MIARYWINAPSTLQPDHKYHGKRVLADIKPDDQFVYVWFADNGPDVSIRMDKLYLSAGWFPETPTIVQYLVTNGAQYLMHDGNIDQMTHNSSGPKFFNTVDAAETAIKDGGFMLEGFVAEPATISI